MPLLTQLIIFIVVVTLIYAISRQLKARFTRQNSGKRIVRLRPDDAQESFYCAVVGESFANDDGQTRQSIIKRHAKAGIHAHLEREPNNRFDSNAIAVYVADNQIGYLKSDVASRHAASIDSGRLALYAVVESVNGGTSDKPSLGVTLEVTIFKVRRQ